MKKIFLFFLFCGFFVLSFDMAVAQNGEGEGAGECDSQLAVEAEQASAGMDALEYGLMLNLMNTTKDAVSTTGASAKKIYQLDGMAKGTLATVAAGKYAKCTAAIKKCESKCEADIKAEEKKQSPNTELIGKYQDTLNSCTAQKSICNQNALQAAISGMQAATSFIGAKAVGGGEDDDDDKEEKETTPAPPRVPGLPPGGGVGGLTASCPDCSSGEAEEESEPIRPPSGPENPTKKTKKNQKKKVAGKGGSARDPASTLSGPLFRPSSSGSMGGSIGGSPTGSAGGDTQASAPDFIQDEEWLDEEGEAQDYGSGPSSLGSGSAFAGGSGYRAGGGKGGSSTRGRGGKGKGKGKKDLRASNKKGPKQSKRNVFGKSNDSIFKKMSRRIQSYCSAGGVQC